MNADIQRLALEPGDYVVVKLDQELTQEHVDHLIASLKAALPDNKAIILGPDITLEKVTAEDLEALLSAR